jgi:flagellar biosynthesis anti-sigma factor FlgM
VIQIQKGVTMRIDLYNSAASQLSTEAKPRPVNADGVAGSDSTATEDRTTLASGSASVDSLVSQAMNSPEIRQDKVASLQQAISSGQYPLDPQKIAAAMVDENA